MVTSISFGQVQRDAYKKIDYIKVNTDQIEQFIEHSENNLRSAYSSLIETTDLQNWILYKVQYPGGEKSGYDFISIATASSTGFFQDHFSKITTPKFIPPNTDVDFADICSLVKSEIWKVENDTIPKSTVNPSRYMTMDYMDVAPGKGLDYLMLEDEIARPIHEQRIDNEKMAGWEVYSLILPSGTEYGYNYATGNYFDKLEYIEYGFTTEIIQQTMGRNSDIPELFNTIYSTRDLVKVELWELVTHAK
jgi:hypothetical protein